MCAFDARLKVPIADVWDKPVHDTFYNEWKLFFMSMFRLEDLYFPRCVKPRNAVGNPSLIIFSDGSKLAYGACVYVRWYTDDNKFLSCFIDIYLYSRPHVSTPLLFLALSSPFFSDFISIYLLRPP